MTMPMHLASGVYAPSRPAEDDWVTTPSGLVAPNGATRAYYDHQIGWMKKRPLAVSLFSGAGGADLGMIQGGFHVVAALEWDEAAAMTYLHNLGADHMEMHFVEDTDRERFEKALLDQGKRDRQANRKRPPEKREWDDPARPIPPWLRAGQNRRAVLGDDDPGTPHIWIGDARRVSGKEILDALGLDPGDVDCVFGGPPCQGFSYSGRRQVMDPRNSLVFDFTRIVLQIKPKIMFFENVPGIISMVTPDGFPVLDVMCRMLADGGMGTFEALKRSLAANSKSGAALLRPNGKLSEKKGRREDAEPQTPDPQVGLFDLEEARG